MRTTAVFVDLDNTLIDGSSLYHLGQGLAARRLVSRWQLTLLAAHHAGFRMRGERTAGLVAARERGLRLAAGLPVQRITALAEQLYEPLLAPRMRPGCVELLKCHLAAGTQVWLATAAPIEIATLIARRLGLSGALGTRSEVRDGAWTGRLTGPVLHGPAKADAVRVLASDHGFDLADCAAYSDSIHDLPLLQAVGRPAVVNPDRRLRRLAEARDWPIHDFGPGGPPLRRRATRGPTAVLEHLRGLPAATPRSRPGRFLTRSNSSP